MASIQQPAASGTTLESAAATALNLNRVRAQRSLWNNAWHQFKHHRLAMAGLVVFVFFTIATFSGPYIWPEEVNAPFAFDTGITPSLDHPMGTDSLGQDILARILYGGRISISVGLVAAFVAISLGTLVGAMAGFFGGFTDSLLMRITDLFLALPQLPLLLLITYLYAKPVKDIFGKDNGILILIVCVIGFLNWMPTARLVRASFLSLKEKEFVEAARCIGATTPSIIFKHILPNVLSPVIVAATLGVAYAILLESSLSYLGLGVQPPSASWGNMLSNARGYMWTDPWLTVYPGALIFLTVLLYNWLGDGLRDALDPSAGERGT